MKALGIVPALALAAALLAPPAAEAGHRHGPGCGHGYRGPSYSHGHRGGHGYSGRTYSRGPVHHHGPRSGHRGYYRPAPYYYGGYYGGGYYAQPYPTPGYYGYGYGSYPPPPVYPRPRVGVGIYFGF